VIRQLNASFRVGPTQLSPEGLGMDRGLGFGLES